MNARRCWTLVVAASAVALAACSQTAALAPVGGDRLAQVRFAAIDVLTDQQVAILVAPVCTASGAKDASVSCQGMTTAQQKITVTSTAADQDVFDVVVGTTTIFHGTMHSVLESAARPS